MAARSATHIEHPNNRQARIMRAIILPLILFIIFGGYMLILEPLGVR